MFEIFKIGFLPFTFLDLIDIVLVALIIYKLYSITKGTIAAQIFIGFLVIFFLSFIAQAASLRALGYLLNLVTSIWVIAFIVLFQPEIRRLLVILGKNPLFNVFVKSDENTVADIITEASFELAQHQHGALMVYLKSTGLRSVIESGEVLNAKLSKNMLRSIFFPRSPLHDGAVIINHNHIEAARCTLPLTELTSIDGRNLGMRHRAGIGITENADVISIIVSEETGSISVAERGHITSGLSKEGLRNLLAKSMMSNSKEKGIKNIIESFRKRK
ncbi:MAG: TIGR00159 family protein [Ignavibacteriales bacterium]|nr:diadenylate cyclase CdaA [Ignavibacteriota bacterium]MCB9220025.1 TIGR00159 family protein [Ignavibacteriales bacterium]